MKRVLPQKKRLKIHLYLDRQLVSSSCSLPVQPCPYITKYLPQAQVHLLSLYHRLPGSVLKDGWSVVSIKVPLSIPAFNTIYLTMTQVFPMAPSPTITILTPTASINRIDNKSQQ